MGGGAEAGKEATAEAGFLLWALVGAAAGVAGEAEALALGT